MRKRKKKKRIVLLMNNLKWSSETIETIYKERWQIELFFQGGKIESKNKTVLRELAERCDDASLDSVNSVSVVLYIEDERKECRAFVYQFHIADKDDVVSPCIVMGMPVQSLSASAKTDNGTSSSAGVCMVVPFILDTNEIK